MRKWIGFRKSIHMKSAAFVVALCLIFVNQPVFSYASESTDDIHNVSENKGDNPDYNEIGNDGEDQENNEKVTQKSETQGTDTEEDKSNVDFVEKDKTEEDTSNTDQEDADEGDSDTDDNTTNKDEDSDDNVETEEPKDDGKEEEEIKDQETEDEVIKDQDTENEEVEDQETEGEETKEETDNEKDDQNGNEDQEDAVSGNDIGEKGDTVSGNDIGEKEDTISGNDIGDVENEEQEMPEIIDVVVPTNYTLAMNPYGLPIRMGEDTMSTEQVISGTYGIVNKSSTDQIVTVSLTVEDRSGEELLFVDSAEEAKNAGRNVYAIYLAAVPANEEQVLIDGEPVDGNVTGESLRSVDMTGASEQAVVLGAGTKQISFKLSRAVYAAESKEQNTETDSDYEEDDTDISKSEDEEKPEFVFQELASDGLGVTAYTFTGVMNPDAEWEKLSGGIKLSVVYTYQTADGSEEIVEGTGAMLGEE